MRPAPPSTDRPVLAPGHAVSLPHLRHFYALASRPCGPAGQHRTCARNPRCVRGLGERKRGVWAPQAVADSSLLTGCVPRLRLYLCILWPLEKFWISLCV
jgi:hypothetical protein